MSTEISQQHTAYIGDSRNMSEVLHGSAELAVTSPPYYS